MADIDTEYETSNLGLFIFSFLRLQVQNYPYKTNQNILVAILD